MRFERVHQHKPEWHTDEQKRNNTENGYAERLPPHFGPNTKRLKGELSDFYRYRVGEYRLFYTIDEQEVIVVVVVDLRRRQNCYRKSDQRAVGSHHDDGRMPKSLQIVVSLLE